MAAYDHSIARAETPDIDSNRQSVATGLMGVIEGEATKIPERKTNQCSFHRISRSSDSPKDLTRDECERREALQCNGWWQRGTQLKKNQFVALLRGVRWIQWTRVQVGLFDAN